MSKSATNSTIQVAKDRNFRGKLAERGGNVLGWLLCAAMGVALAGCQTDSAALRGDGFTKDATWGQEFRASDSSGDQYGFSNRARQIENSLGVN